MLTHDDEDMRNERTNAYNFSRDNKIGGTASNANWSAQTGYQKPINAGGVDAYRMRQNQLNSNVLDQTDHSQYAPMQKKQADADDAGWTAPPKGFNNK